MNCEIPFFTLKLMFITGFYLYCRKFIKILKL